MHEKNETRKTLCKVDEKLRQKKRLRITFSAKKLNK